MAWDSDFRSDKSNRELTGGPAPAQVLEPRLVEMGPVEVGAQTFEPRVAMAMCQTMDQVAHAIAEHDAHRELIKTEIVPAFGPNGIRSYRVIIWSLPWP